MKYINIIKSRFISIMKSLLLCSIGLFTWLTYEKQWLSIFNKYILPYLDISTNIWLIIVAVIFIIFAVIVFLRNLYYRYRITTNQIWILLVVCVIYAKYRFSSLYLFSYIIKPIAYLDLIIILASLLVIVDFINYLRNLYIIYKFEFIHKLEIIQKKMLKIIFKIKLKKILKIILKITPKIKLKNNKDTNKWIPDQPICNEDEDLLDYKIDAKRLAEDLNKMPFGRSWSIGIVSQWGTGKSSFLNLVEEVIDPKSFIIIKYNPRYAKNVQSIQEDFFSTFSTALKPYNASFSSMFRDYMEALQILDKKNIITAILNLQKIADKKSAKEKISTLLRKISKKIIIIIEDFDRLFSDEIIEIFKLIDGNASLPNVIFLTAYDKNHLNKMINAKSAAEESSFSDKFFSIEIMLPIRPYSKIHEYLVKEITERINLNKEEQDIYCKTLNGYYYILERYLTTLRDVKRFINLFINDYLPIKEEVVFQDFFLLSIIKYKDPTVHKKLFNKEYFVMPPINNYYTAKKENQEIEIPYMDILKRLFPDEPIGQEYLRRINSIHAFEIYFVNQVYGMLKKQDMEELLKKDFDLAKNQIELWESEKRINDLIEFLSIRNLLDFPDKNIFNSYIRIVFYLSCKHYGTTLYFIILKLVSTKNTNEITSRYNFIDESEYINFIKEHFITYPPYPSEITKNLIINSIDGDNFIFSKSDLLSISKEYLIDSLREDTMKEIHMSLLYSCISDMIPKSRKVILDQSSCELIKDMIQKSPEYYINNFVRLGMISSSPDYNTIACEPFWKSIFKEKDAFKSFIENTKLDSLEKIKLVRNFWKLYENNDYSPISIEGENVQNLIDNDLDELIKHLEELQDIQNAFNEYKVAHISPNNSKDTESINYYQDLIDRIIANQLHIKYSGTVINSIIKERQILENHI